MTGSLIVGLVLLLQEPALPELTGSVVDTADVLSAEEEERLTNRLEALELDLSAQVVVATIPTLAGEPIEDYTTRLAEFWQIGRSSPVDYDAVILLAVQDQRVHIKRSLGRRMARIFMVLRDDGERSIGDTITPAVQRGHYFMALNAALALFKAEIQRSGRESEQYSREIDESSRTETNRFVALFFGLAIVLAAIIGISRRQLRRIDEAKEEEAEREAEEWAQQAEERAAEELRQEKERTERHREAEEQARKKKQYEHEAEFATRLRQLQLEVEDRTKKVAQAQGGPSKKVLIAELELAEKEAELEYLQHSSEMSEEKREEFKARFAALRAQIKKESKRWL